MYHALFKQFNPQTDLILTPTQRLAAYLRAQYDSYQLARQTQWDSPTILDQHTWLRLSWEACQDPHLILSSLQEWQIWQSIIEAHAVKKNLSIDSAYFAELSQQAWKLLHDGGIPLEELKFSKKTEAQLFYQWANTFHRHCQKNSWLSKTCLANALLERMRHLSETQTIYLIAFDDIQNNINKLLDKHPATIHHWAPSPDGQAKRIALNDSLDEIETMARWAFAQQQANLEANILCIVPNLSEIQSDVKRIFSQILEPSNTPFNLSAGYALYDAPLIKAALELISLPSYEIDYLALTQLLTSPFLAGSEQEMSQRAAVDALLRTYQQPKLSWSFIAKILSQKKQWQNLSLNRLITTHIQQVRQRPRQATAQTWVEHFQQILTQWGWPGERTLNSEEYQLGLRWQQLLDEFATLDYIQGPCSYQEALTALKQLAYTNTFQPETTSQPRIQIVGALEASGLESDYCWIMGLHDTAWPSRAAANPLLPIALQRRFDLPNSSPEHALTFTKKLTERLVGQSQQVIVSYPKQLNNLKLHPSNLIQFFDIIEKNEISLADQLLFDVSLHQSASLETWHDDRGQRLDTSQLTHGGASLFQNQAACPFKAYATHRLNAKSLERPTAGLSPIDRGNIVHSALEFIWRELHNQQQLLAQTPKARDKLIGQSLAFAWRAQFPDPSLEPGAQSTTLERMRLTHLLQRWLTLEAARLPFKVVACEQWLTIHLNGIKARLKVDRIDELENGERLIIDYKTGKTSTQGWFEARLQNPQLPLYAVTQLHTEGITFASLQTETLGWRGLAAKSFDIKGITAANDWPSTLENWKNQLNLLAKEYIDARADAAPYKPQTCRYCDLHSFCRIYDQSKVAL